jgi:hypothetical protein
MDSCWMCNQELIDEKPLKVGGWYYSIESNKKYCIVPFLTDSKNEVIKVCLSCDSQISRKKYRLRNHGKKGKFR